LASIGDITCFRVIGTLPSPKTKLAVWTVPGIDGYGVQALGQQDQAFEVVAVLYDSIDNAISFKDNLCDLQGQIVTIVDDLGDSTDNCVILSVGQAVMEAALTPSSQVRCAVPIRGVVNP
jgi:hypothetical protein